jgi:hypothetical protein
LLKLATPFATVDPCSRALARRQSFFDNSINSPSRDQPSREALSVRAWFFGVLSRQNGIVASKTAAKSCHHKE